MIECCSGCATFESTQNPNCHVQHPTPNTQHPTRKAFKLSALILLGATVFMACQKDALAPTTPDTINESGATPLVKAFIERANRLGFEKSDVALTLDSAEWYIEAALNFSYAEAWVSAEEVRRDTLRFELLCDQDLVSSEAVYTTYLNAAAQLVEGWDDESEHLILVDVQTQVRNGTPVVDVIYMVGARGGTKSLNTYFGPNDYYLAMWEVAYPTNCGCGPNVGGSGPCAAKQIQGRLNTALPPVSVGQYFTNVEVCYMGGPGYFWSCENEVVYPIRTGLDQM